MKRNIKLATVAVLSAATIGAAYAAQSRENDALGISSVKTSLTQAISIAEQHVGGKASHAQFEHEKGTAIFEIEVVKGQSVIDVTVDPATGNVIAAVDDRSDHDEDRGEHEDHDRDHGKTR